MRIQMKAAIFMYYRGESDFAPGEPVGHEFIGVVELCPNCRAGITTACTHGGFIPAGDGGRGELVRVPLADGTVVKVDGKPSGDTVAVIGDGAVGLCGVVSATLARAQRIVALRRHPQRQAPAKEFGATDIVEARDSEAVADTYAAMTSGAPSHHRSP